MRFIFVLVCIIMMADTALGAELWVNNITVGEYNMTWNYTETFSGMNALAYRVNLDKNIGDNNSFINAWEVLEADKEMRKDLRSSIEKEQDVRINNETSGVELIDIDSTMSPELIGKTHSVDTVVNRYNISYGFKESIFNASSIWFLGQANSPVTIIMPAGVDVINISGLNNVSRKTANNTEISGSFNAISAERGEITLRLSRNESAIVMNMNATSTETPYNATETNVTKPMINTLSRVRDAGILLAGVVIILLIYLFKMRRH